MTFVARILEKDVSDIVGRVFEGQTYASIAKLYGVSRQRVCQIAQREKVDGVGMAVRREASRERNLERSKRIYGEFFDGKAVSDRGLVTRCKEKFRYKKSQAKYTGVPFEIEFQDVKWNRICPILGVEIDYFSDGKAEGNSASFDRVDQSQGYIKGNVQIISFRANVIKNSGTAEEHAKIVEYILKNRP